MSMTNAQRTLWARELLFTFRDRGIVDRIANQNLIETGANTWKVITGTSLTASDVDDGADITYAALSDSALTISVNYDKHVPFIDIDTDRVGTNLDGLYQREFSRDAALALTNGFDRAVFADHAQAGSDFFEDGVSTAWQFTVTTCADVPAFFGKLDKAAKDLNWPDEADRFIVAPSGFKEAIFTYTGGKDSAFGDSTLRGGLRNMFMYAGWNIIISNNLTTASSVTHGMAGLVGKSIAIKPLIDTRNSVETMRAEGRHGTLYRPRLRAAYKVYQPQALIDINFNSTVVATS